MIRLTNRQANKITGIYNNIWVIEPIKVEDDFHVVKLGLNHNYGIGNRYLSKLVAQGKAVNIDMSIPSVDRTKVLNAFNRERVKVDYEGRHITSEL